MKGRKNIMINQQTQAEQMLAGGETAELAVTEAETLTYQGFNEDEILSLLWLRQWYQHGGSDRVEVVRRLEFLQQLLREGRLSL
jgi:hypothetical protein